jgi:hypothetical protein
MKKMTPDFLKIAKQTKKAAGMNEILDGNGNEFRTDEDQKRYITMYYSDIYKVKADTNKDLLGFEEFLGPDILNAPEVINSKLMVAQRDQLETRLTINELNEASKAMKLTSAGGPDRIGVLVLKKFGNF